MSVTVKDPQRIKLNVLIDVAYLIAIIIPSMFSSINQIKLCTRLIKIQAKNIKINM